jgi:hypothetical protein
MHFDAPDYPPPKEWASHLRYKGWQDWLKPGSRARRSRRFFYCIHMPLSIAALGCIWWALGFGADTRSHRMDTFILGCTLAILPLLIRTMLRIR